MRGGVVSEDPFKWIHELRKEFPEIFDPDIVSREWSPQKIEKAIKSVTPGILNGKGVGTRGAGALGYKIDEHSKAWYENAVSLSTYWGSDLRNVFWGRMSLTDRFRIYFISAPLNFKRGGMLVTKFTMR